MKLQMNVFGTHILFKGDSEELEAAVKIAVDSGIFKQKEEEEKKEEELFMNKPEVQKTEKEEEKKNVKKTEKEYDPKKEDSVNELKAAVARRNGFASYEEYDEAKTITKLHDKEKKSFKKIAEEMGLSYVTVQKRYHKLKGDADERDKTEHDVQHE